jgi:diguanylate cyclase (GGDEF)-like protein
MTTDYPDDLRVMRNAAWMWILYLAFLAVLNTLIYARADGPLAPVLWYHIFNTLPALIFAGLSFSKWNRKGDRLFSSLMILLISVSPILVNYLFHLQLPPGPLANLEGMFLLQVPVLMIGLVLVAWHHNMALMILYSIATSLFELSLAFSMHYLEDPRNVSFYFIILVRAICFIVIGIFINQLITRLRNQAIRDSLTGLYNRHHLNEFLNQYVARARREKKTIAFVLMDIDYFKRFNDTHGHLAGDAMLHAVGKLLEKNTRQGDIACRFGGEEFLLVMPGALLEDAFVRAEQIREILQNHRIQYAGMRLNCTISAGVAGYPGHGSSIEEVLRTADDALYAAKQAGRNCVMHSHPKEPGSNQSKPGILTEENLVYSTSA